MKPFAIGAARLAALGFTVSGCIPQPWLASAGPRGYRRNQSKYQFATDKCGAPVSPHSAQPSPEEPVEWGQLRLLHRAMQNAQLVPERKVFQLESGSGFED